MSAKWLREQFHEVLVDAGIETQAEADAAAKADDGTILHGLRRSAGTHWQILGIEREVIEALLDHQDASVTGVYARWDYWPKRVAALLAWERYLLRNVNAKPILERLNQELKHVA